MKSNKDKGISLLWKKYFIILPVKITTSGAAYDENIINMTTFLFQCRDHFCMGPVNEGRRYIVTSSLVGWTHTQNDPCQCIWNHHGDAALLDPFHNVFMSSIIQISWKYLLLRHKKIIRSYYNFVLATTAEMPWHRENCDMIGSSESKLEQI